MPETPRQRRTAASIIEGIKKRLEAEQEAVTEINHQYLRSKICIEALQEVLADAEKNGEAE